MRIALVTDAWHPQVNGVVRSIEALVAASAKLGATVVPLTAEGFLSVALPTYRDIRLALPGTAALARRLDLIAPDHIHIATEGPLGFAVRRQCLCSGRIFTTSYHTQFPDYLAARAPIPRRLTYAALRWFHNAGAGTMVAAPSVAADLQRRGFRNIMRWSRGVDPGLFQPRAGSVLDLPRPIFLSVGRLAVEKNLEAFLSLELPGSKVVVGDGPARAGLQARYPAATFLGLQTGEALARIYASADAFVFPSRTDTYGIVLLEALASGLPVAAFPVRGPLDVVGGCEAAVLDEDLGAACRRALGLPREVARAYAMGHSWADSARQFLGNIRAVRALLPANLAA